MNRNQKRKRPTNEAMKTELVGKKSPKKRGRPANKRSETVERSDAAENSSTTNKDP